MADADTRFTEPLGGVVRDSNGRITEPPPGPARDRALAAERAWRRYWRTGDRRGLVRLGLLPEEDQ